MMDASNDEMDVDETTVNPVKLMDFPNEVLLRVFRNFTDTHLLDMSRVCTRFEAIANETFAKRYDGGSEDKYFKIFCNLQGEEAVYLPIFEVFGKKITALEINMQSRTFSEDFWVYRFIRDFCSSSSITHVIVKEANESFNYQQLLNSMPAIKYLTFENPHNNRWANYYYVHVISFDARNFRPIEDSIVRRFVQKNPQLQNLKFDGIFEHNPLPGLSGKLNRLESLVLDRNYMESLDLSEVTFERLKSLTISLEHFSAVNILQAIQRGCKHIECLEVTTYRQEQEPRFEGLIEDFDTFHAREKAEKTRHFAQLIQAIGPFNRLTSFSLGGCSYQSDFLDILAEHLPKCLRMLRSEFQDLYYHEFECNDILHVFIKLKHLEKMSFSFFGAEDHEYGFFGLDWCREFTAIAMNRKRAIRLEYNDKESTIIATNDKCITNGELRYWAGYEPDRSQSKTHILDLNEKCIDKILEWLPDSDVRNVYQTCKTLKNIAAKRIWSKVVHFGVCDIPEFEGWLNIMAEDIRKLEIDIDDLLPGNDNLKNHSSEKLKLVRDRCSKNLNEFRIDIAETTSMDDLNLSFPNLEKLTIDHIVTAGSKVLPTINCPKLKYLDIGSYEIGANEDNIQIDIQDFRLGLSIDNLTVLKLQQFDDVIARLFVTLSDKICDQLTEFTIAAVNDPVDSNRAISMISRFRNLIELNLIFPGIEFTNTDYLFERCIKLVKLSFAYGHYNDKMQRLWKNCKQHCKDLKVIQLVREDAVHTFDEKICQFISEEFPRVQLYNVSRIDRWHPRINHKITLWNKSLIPKDCERPY